MNELVSLDILSLQSGHIQVQATIKNIGNVRYTFYVTAQASYSYLEYYGPYLASPDSNYGLGVQTITLDPGEEGTVTFNVTQDLGGSYNIPWYIVVKVWSREPPQDYYTWNLYFEYNPSDYPTIFDDWFLGYAVTEVYPCNFYPIGYIQPLHNNGYTVTFTIVLNDYPTSNCGGTALVEVYLATDYTGSGLNIQPAGQYQLIDRKEIPIQNPSVTQFLDESITVSQLNTQYYIIVYIYEASNNILTTVIIYPFMLVESEQTMCSCPWLIPCPPWCEYQQEVITIQAGNQQIYRS